MHEFLIRRALALALALALTQMVQLQTVFHRRRTLAFALIRRALALALALAQKALALALALTQTVQLQTVFHSRRTFRRSGRTILGVYSNPSIWPPRGGQLRNLYDLFHVQGIARGQRALKALSLLR